MIRPLRIVAWVAIGAVLVGVFSTWTEIGATTLNGTQGPNDGWLVVIVACFAVVWLRLMEQSSWTGAIGVVGMLGAAVVICWTAIEDWHENREVFDAVAGHGFWLVVAGGVALAVVAVIRGFDLVRALR